MEERLSELEDAHFDLSEQVRGLRGGVRSLRRLVVGAATLTSSEEQAEPSDSRGLRQGTGGSSLSAGRGQCESRRLPSDSRGREEAESVILALKDLSVLLDENLTKRHPDLEVVAPLNAALP